MFPNLPDNVRMPDRSACAQSVSAASLNFESSVWIFWIHPETFSDPPCLTLNSWFAWKSKVRFSTYVFLKNSLNSIHLSKFLCDFAILGSPLILVNINLYNLSSWIGVYHLESCIYIWNESKYFTSLLFPLNGVTNLRTSLTLTYSSAMLPDLSVSAILTFPSLCPTLVFLAGTHPCSRSCFVGLLLGVDVSRWSCLVLQGSFLQGKFSSFPSFSSSLWPPSITTRLISGYIQ
jgi:hypothetical protein